MTVSNVNVTIPTFNGLKGIEDIKAGDTIINADGTTTKVTNVYHSTPTGINNQSKKLFSIDKYI